jgi:hypothetical protein
LIGKPEKKTQKIYPFCPSSIRDAKELDLDVRKHACGPHSIKKCTIIWERKVKQSG